MSQVKPIPDGYQRLITYLTVDNLPRLKSFLIEAFDAQPIECITDDQGVIRHLELRFHDTVLMAAEARPECPAKTTGFYLYTEDCDAAYQRALAAGGTSIMEPADQFYGDRHGGVLDPTGNQWFVATRIENVEPEELQRRAAANMK